MNMVNNTVEPNELSSNNTRHDPFKTTVKWFAPAIIAVALMSGLGATGFCILFCSPSSTEEFLLKLAGAVIFASAIYIPVVSAIKISQARTRQRKFLEVLGLTLLGYFLIITVSVGWILISQPLNEGIVESIDRTILNQKEAERQKQIVNSNIGEEITFTQGEAHLAKLDDKYTVVSLSGKVSGLYALNNVQSYENLVLITKVSLNGTNINLSEEDQQSRLGSFNTMGVYNAVQLKQSESQNVELEVILPTEEVTRLAPDSKYQFDVAIEIWSQSPYTWKPEPLWERQSSFDITEEEVYFRDQVRMFSVFLPQGTTVLSTKYIDNKFIPVENDSSISYIIRSRNGGELKSYRGEEAIKINDYISKSGWGKFVTQTESLTGADVDGSDLLYVLVTTDKNTRPYKQIIQGYNYEAQTLEFTELNKPDEDLEKVFNKYVSIIKNW